MQVEQVMFRSGAVRCAGNLYLPDGVGDRAPAPAVVMGHSAWACPRHTQGDALC